MIKELTLVTKYENGTSTQSKMEFELDNIEILEDKNSIFEDKLQVFRYNDEVYIAKGKDLRIIDFIYGNIIVYTHDMILDYLLYPSLKSIEFTSYIRSIIRDLKLKKLIE